ncbi:hypothetical protein JCM9533A_22360 [Catenuloplanes niger JCM 9533]
MLRLIGAAPAGLRVKEIADALGPAQAAARGIPHTLAHVGCVTQDDGRYRLCIAEGQPARAVLEATA